VRRSVLAAIVVLLAAAPAAADLSQPALLDLTETAPGRYEVVFKLPRLGTRVLALRPVLPPVFRALSEPTYEIVQGAQVARWTVEADPWSLGGQRVEIEGLGASISDTVVRFRFRDGTVVTRILLPESPSCEIPEPTAAGDATAAESRRLARAIRGPSSRGSATPRPPCRICCSSSRSRSRCRDAPSSGRSPGSRRGTPSGSSWARGSA
jgi:hypothetical protein